MREILFRGKRLDNGEWVTGTPFIAADCCKMIHAVAVHPDFVDEGNVYYSEGFPVDPETVGQFTGLTDKKGKRIFDGDILRADNGKQTAVFIVKYGDYLPEMFYKMLDMYVPGKRHLLAHGFYAVSIGKGEEMIMFQSPCAEILGNVHDNPELLEVSK